MALNISFKGELLIGRSNYIDWLRRANLFLEINGFMPYIDGSEAGPNKDLYYGSDNKPYSNDLAVKFIDKESEFNRNSLKALNIIKSIISIDNTERFKDKRTAQSLWEAIKATYGETGIETIARFFNKLIDVNYNSFKNADKYISYI